MKTDCEVSSEILCHMMKLNSVPNFFLQISAIKYFIYMSDKTL